jgi:hypothetical protein
MVIFTISKNLPKTMQNNQGPIYQKKPSAHFRKFKNNSIDDLPMVGGNL